MAWITAISLASFFWFLASNSNLESSGREDVRRCETTREFDTLLRAFILAGRLLLFFLPVFDYPLYDGIGGEAVPAVHDPQDSSPPRLLDVNKTGPNENESDYSNASGWGSYSIRVRSIPARVYFCPPMTNKIHLWKKKKTLLHETFLMLSVLLAVFRRFHLL